jgi:hypothetical protein
MGKKSILPTAKFRTVLFSILPFVLRVLVSPALDSLKVRLLKAKLISFVAKVSPGHAATNLKS